MKSRVRYLSRSEDQSVAQEDESDRQQNGVSALTARKIVGGTPRLPSDVIFGKISQTPATRHLRRRVPFWRVGSKLPTVSRSDRPNEVSPVPFSPPAIRRHRLNCINIRLYRRTPPFPRFAVRAHNSEIGLAFYASSNRFNTRSKFMGRAKS